MKLVIKLITCLLITVILFLNSCKKEYSCERCIGNNQPPIAVAGPDTLITLLRDSVLLDGSKSSDPDGKICAWQWTKVAGPASFTIVSAIAAITTVKNLNVGAYQFELKVTDDKGASARDTVMITVDSTATSNHPPVGCAGADRTITLPTDTVTLDGSCSTDLDNNITSYSWTKVTGPSSFSITNTNAIETQVSNLTEGTYQFELKVTDAGGLFSKDTVQVTVKSQDTACDNNNRPIINIPLVPFATIPVLRTMITVATVGNKLLLAGGWLQSGSNSSSRVDIYDFSTQSWSSTNISVPRAEMATATLGNKVFFAGGEVPGFWGTSLVDIYDASTNTWSEAQLSGPRGLLSIAVLGQKIFFTDDDDGSSGDKVDIYDDATKAWSVITLRGAHIFSTATAAGNKVYFAGGYKRASAFSSTITADIDIYDDATRSWSFSSLSQPTASMSSIFIDGKIYWAGGVVGYDALNDRDISTCRVEIRDVNTQSSFFTNLSHPTSFVSNEQNQPIFYKGKILFGGVSDIYDPLNNSWSIGKLPQNVSVESVVLINNGLYAIGHVIGASYPYLSDQIWKLQY